MNSEQNIVVGFADEDFVANDAKLTIREAVGGTSYELEGSKYIAGAVLFTVPGSQIGTGAFSVETLRYRDSSSQEVVVDFSSDDKSSYIFDCLASPEKETEEGAITAYTLDDDGYPLWRRGASKRQLIRLKKQLLPPWRVAPAHCQQGI